VAACRLAVRRALADLHPGEVVLVACSGGADSLALAAASAFEAGKVALQAVAVVIDHRLQHGSAAVAAAAARTCAGLGLTTETVTVTVQPSGAGPEAAARCARYAALEEVASRWGAAVVLLGHTRDDQAEQVLLGLARGSGARSLAGMPARRGLYRRPFLGLSRSQVRCATEDLGLESWQDPANDDLRFTRVRVRSRVLPVLEAELGPGIGEALARTADLLRDDADALDTLADAALSGLPQLSEGIAVADLPDPPALRRRVLRAALAALDCPALAVHLAAVDALVTDWHGQRPVNLPAGVTVARRSGMLVAVPSAHLEEP
jgi:tRNA(Ile)-lysidine synthase